MEGMEIFDEAAKGAEFKEGVSAEIAEKEFEAWCEANRIKRRAGKEEAFDELKEKIIEACVEGRLVFDGRKVEYTVSGLSEDGLAGRKITFSPLKGNAAIAAGSAKNDADKVTAVLSCQTGLEIGFFKKLDMFDYNTVTTISTFFILV